MITHPKLKAKYHVENIPGDGVFLLAETDTHVLEGESLRHILPLLNGQRTWQDIVREVAPLVTQSQAEEAINVLLASGHVVENDPYMPSNYEVFWTELGRDSRQVAELLSHTNVHIRTFGQVAAEPLSAALGSLGFEQNLMAPPSLILVVTDDYQATGIADVNTYCLAHNIPWLLVKPAGLKLMVGPFVVPYKTACWQCLETRVRHNREVESYIARKTNRTEPFPVVKSRIPLAEMQAVSITVIQLLRWLCQGHHESLESRIMTIDLLSTATQYHQVVKRPQCPACGNPSVASRAGLPVHINAIEATDKNGNGSRLESPESTFARYAHHVSDITGIIKGIYPSPWNERSPLKIFMAGHNFALNNGELFFLKDGLRSSSSGKGRSEAQARTSALCEALERYSGVSKGEEITRLGSYSQLVGEAAIHPASIMLYSDKQYRERDQWFGRGRFQVVPMAFDEQAEINWTPVWSLTESRVKLLPTSYLYFGFKDKDEKFYCWGDSNGNAAGSCLEDALLQGFLELIERDSVALWWYNQVSRPAVDLDSLGDPYITGLRTYYHGLNREFWVLDLTTDTGIPSFVAINRRTNHAKEDIIMGFGAHLDARIAINRAITEMNQFIPAVLNVDAQGESTYLYDDQEAIRWWQTATVANQPYLVPTGPAISIEALPTCQTTDLKQQLEQCLATATRLGLEVLVLDQTRPDIGLPVVKVIVPGLRHFWARFAPGRLYDVPVSLGWLATPKTEEELNPIPMFL